MLQEVPAKMKGLVNMIRVQGHKGLSCLIISSIEHIRMIHSGNIFNSLPTPTT